MGVSEIRHCRTFALANIKGGSTKTTTGLHLADAMSRYGKGLLIDMDPQADATDFLWPDASLEDLTRANALTLLKGATLEDTVRPGLFVDLVPAIIDLAELGAQAMRQPAILHRLRKILEKASSYSWCIVDTPGAIGAELTASLIAADVLLIPVTPSKWAVRAVTLLLREFENARDEKAPAYIVPSCFGKSERDQTILEMLAGLPGIRGVLPAIPKSAAIQNRTEASERLKESSGPGAAFATLAKEVNKL